MARTWGRLGRYFGLAIPVAVAAACGDAGLSRSGDAPGGAHPASTPDAGGDGVDAGATADARPSGDGGSADTAPPGEDADAAPLPGGRRAIPPGVLARKAICYSGYRAGQSPETQTYPTDDQIKSDLELLIQGGWTFLRLFDCSPFAEAVMRVIEANGYDIKLMSGIWLSGDKEHFDAQNQTQIDQCVSLYSKYGDLVAAVSVGNETLDSWSSVLVPPAELAAYVQEVRGRITQPVTTDDSYLPFTLGTDGSTSYASVIEVANVVDFLSLHVYAFSDAPYDSWDWKQLATPAGQARAQAMMKAALGYTKDSLNSVRTAMAAHGLDLPIVIGEAGWKTSATDTSDDATEIYRAHQVNQALFYDPFIDWVYGSTKDSASPIAAFTFEAFDEPWKTNDDGWGLFDVDRKARYAMWPSFPALKPAGAPAYTDKDALYYDGGDAAP
jgi:exo-beta-1,3-glucanase (GH17 family)